MVRITAISFFLPFPDWFGVNAVDNTSSSRYLALRTGSCSQILAAALNKKDSLFIKSAAYGRAVKRQMVIVMNEK